ncbi:hypothetical protein Cgig2_026343 [Carnegiea gigantea]|uniref:Thioesterase domain-containing protein n=1 Tax=Carnegiea gigantea TaxID=171969 RepID=A0A9Q1KEX1_9CARY|nr:hypothetical protein Cgig2_026343 [Carnegiea gigantea]
MDESKTEVDKKGQMQNMVLRFIAALGAAQTLPESCETADFYSELIRGLLKVRSISPGRVSCSFRVKRRIANAYNGLHGGAVAAIAERVATACARTLLSEEKPLFLGELSTSYLSSAPINAEVVADGSVVRSGRNLTVVSVEFRLKDYGKLAYTAHATFFNAVPSKL